MSCYPCIKGVAQENSTSAQDKTQVSTIRTPPPPTTTKDQKMKANSCIANWIFSKYITHRILNIPSSEDRKHNYYYFLMNWKH
jgi:hypothetical protein